LINLLSEEKEENDLRNHQTVKKSGGYHDEERNMASLNQRSCTESLICTPAKLSSLKWDPMHGEGVIASGDYDGVVTEWDTEKALAIYERDEHGGRKVWSVDYCLLYHSLCASASDDGTVQMWDKNCNQTVMVLSAPSRKPVCCAEFSPSNGSLVAMACSDHGVYVYDTRRVSLPSSPLSSSSSSALFVLHDHSKPASYVRFFRENMVVSAAIDGSIKLWDISNSMAEAVLPVRSYRGHCNKKNFVGLSVWEEGGLFACGSESNEVFAYDYRWGSPLWTNEFDGNNGGESVGALSEDLGGDLLLLEGRERSRKRMDLGFVSSVCWRQKSL
jgi:E3 ubiquitin-protein ligase RFWD2